MWRLWVPLTVVCGVCLFACMCPCVHVCQFVLCLQLQDPESNSTLSRAGFVCLSVSFSCFVVNDINNRCNNETPLSLLQSILTILTIVIVFLL